MAKRLETPAEEEMTQKHFQTDLMSGIRTSFQTLSLVLKVQLFENACFSAPHTPTVSASESVCLYDCSWWQYDGWGAGDDYISAAAAACERVNPLSAAPEPAKKQLQASTTDEIPHTTTILAH